MTDWTNPRTWVFDELVDETILNTHVRDNLLHLKEQQDAGLSVTARQGGSSTDWSSPGTTNYTPSTPKIEVGSKSFTPASGGGFYGVTGIVTFPSAFTNPPVVNITLGGIALTNSNVMVSVSSVSATQFQVSFLSIYDTGAFRIYWTAIGE